MSWKHTSIVTNNRTIVYRQNPVPHPRVSGLLTLGVVGSAFVLLVFGSILVEYATLYQAVETAVPAFGKDPGAIVLGADEVYHFKYLSTHVSLIQSAANAWDKTITACVKWWHYLTDPIQVIYEFFKDLFSGRLPWLNS